MTYNSLVFRILDVKLYTKVFYRKDTHRKHWFQGVTLKLFGWDLLDFQEKE